MELYLTNLTLINFILILGDKIMKILKDLIKKANDTLDEIWDYTEMAHSLRAEHKLLADTYIEIAEAHVEIYGKLHKKMVMLIEEEKSKNPNIPKVMYEMWEEKHKELIKEFAEVKYLIEEYKKMGY